MPTEPESHGDVEALASACGALAVLSAATHAVRDHIRQHDLIWLGDWYSDGNMHVLVLTHSASNDPSDRGIPRLKPRLAQAISVLQSEIITRGTVGDTDLTSPAWSRRAAAPAGQPFQRPFGSKVSAEGEAKHGLHGTTFTRIQNGDMKP